MDDTVPTIRMIDLLLACTCIIHEEMQSQLDYPITGELRHCNKHGEVAVVRVGYPYYKDDQSKTGN